MSKQHKHSNGVDRSSLREERAALFEAVEALLSELDRFENLATEARKIPLDSQKNLDRSVRSAQEAIETQGRIGERLGALIATINTVRVRQETTASALDEHVHALKVRADQYGVLGDRLASLVMEAREINALVQSCATEMKDAPAGAPQPTSRIDVVLERMTAFSETAQTLMTDAGEDGWSDVVRQTDSMRQQMLSARNKLSLVRREIPAKA
ncbi:MAG: hypothetical protein ABI193_14600 [Minicystis sp.]